MTQATAELDAIVVGAGPNGLAAAITLARAGRSVRVYEAADTAGGGTRTAELTLPGFRHDVCSTILPLTVASPFFQTIDLAARGVELVHPDAPIAHPLDGGRAVVLERSVAATAAALGGADGRAWRRLFGPLVRDGDKLASELLQPVVHLPRHPLALARFGLPALWSADGPGPPPVRWRRGSCPVRRDLGARDARARSPAECGVRARARDVRPRRRLADGPRRCRAVADALVAELRAAGGELVTGHRVGSLRELPPARAVLLRCHAAPAPGDRWPALPRASAAALERFRYGPGVFKVDWALDGPVPWTADGPRRAGDGPPRRHARGDRRRRVRCRRRPHPERPYVLFVQYDPGIPRARPRASRRPGRTATCPPAQRST